MDIPISAKAISDFFQLLLNDTTKNIIFGATGAWANYFVGQYKLEKKLNLKFYFSNVFFLCQWCALGSIVAYVFASPGNKLHSFVFGFGAIAILEQFRDGKGLKKLFEIYINYITKNAENKSNKKLKELEKELEKADESSNEKSENKMNNGDNDSESDNDDNDSDNDDNIEKTT